MYRACGAGGGKKLKQRTDKKKKALKQSGIQGWNVVWRLHVWPREADASDCEADGGWTLGLMGPSGHMSVLNNLEMLIDSDAIIKSGNKRHNMLLMMVVKGGLLEVEN